MALVPTMRTGGAERVISLLLQQLDRDALRSRAHHRLRPRDRLRDPRRRPGVRARAGARPRSRPARTIVLAAGAGGALRELGGVDERSRRQAGASWSSASSLTSSSPRRSGPRSWRSWRTTSFPRVHPARQPRRCAAVGLAGAVGPAGSLHVLHARVLQRGRPGRRRVSRPSGAIWSRTSASMPTGSRSSTTRSTSREIRALAEEPVDEPWFDDDIPIVLFVGRLERVKGLEYLLRAIAEVAADQARALRAGG